MQFHSDYYISHPSEQLKAQQLSRKVFFGPLNVLSRHSFIEENNIRFFICVGIPTQRLASLANTEDECLMVNFDAELDISSSCSVEGYYERNTLLLRKVIDQVLSETSQPQLSDVGCLTPQSQSPELNCELVEDLKYIYQNGNVFAGITGLRRFKIFNDLLTLFNHINPNAGTFIFSQNGNDADLTTLLMSQIILKNPYIRIIESYQFVKSLRPTVNDIKDEQLFWFSGLVEFHESISHGNYQESPTTQRFRKRVDSTEEHLIMKDPVEQDNCKRKRLNQ